MEKTNGQHSSNNHLTNTSRQAFPVKIAKIATPVKSGSITAPGDFLYENEVYRTINGFSVQGILFGHNLLEVRITGFHSFVQICKQLLGTTSALRNSPKQTKTMNMKLRCGSYSRQTSTLIPSTERISVKSRNV